MRRAAVLCAFLMPALAAPPASGAEFGIVPGSVALRMLDAEGDSESRAGSHPDRLQIDFALSAEGTTARDLAFDLPPGFGGRPDAVPECPRELYEKGEEECPAESRVGTLELEFEGGAKLALPLFQIEPGPDEVLSFGSSPGFDAPLSMQVRPDDFGITFMASDLPEVAFTAARAELWGVPADRQEGTAIPRRPLLTAPTRCGPLGVTFRTRSWEPGAPWLSQRAEADAPLEGCESLAFEPRLGMALDNPLADSPTGARIDLSMKQNDDPDGRAHAQLREVSVDLPGGIALSPAGLSGMTACTDAQLRLGETAAASCPPSAKIGGVELESPMLREPLSGEVFLGTERPGERFRMFVVAPGPGVEMKFVTALRLDPASGRLSTVLEGLPPIPVSRLGLRMDGGDEALLASPLDCGTHPAGGRFVPYGGGPAVAPSTSVTVVAGVNGQPCPSLTPFAPRLAVSRASRAAGRPTTLSMTVLRRAGEQLPAHFSIALPKGMSAALGSIRTCPGAATAAGVCPAASRVGGAFAEIGSGATSLRLPGDVYAAGPYRGAPFSLAMAFHAAIGPFDLGTLAVRSAVRLHRRSARVFVVSDSLPSLGGGMPVRFRAINMAIDRPRLIRNPTSCAANAVTARFTSSAGATALATGRVAIEDCDRLAFKPRFSLSLTARQGGRGGLRVSTRLGHGNANLRAVRMSFPRALRFSTAGLREICPRRDAVDGLCSARAKVGTALVRSPLLDRPFRGSIYTVQPQGDGLPDLWVSLAGGGMRLDVRGRVTTRRGRIVTHLAGLPDMPISVFSMRLLGGRRGALRLRGDPCRRAHGKPLIAALAAKGQNGARRRLRLPVRAGCERNRPSRRAVRVGPARPLTPATAR